MTDFSHLNEIYRKIPFSLGKYGILHWYELKHWTFSNPIYLYGDFISCELFEERFRRNSITISGTILAGSTQADTDLPENAKVIVTFKDYPGNIELFMKTEIELKKLGITPYVIHDFSAGFAIGTEKIVKDRENVYEAYSFLSDSLSKECFLSFLSHISVPYHWNMDMKKDNFGIPDPLRDRDNTWVYDDVPVSCISSGYLLCCNTGEFRKNNFVPNLLDYQCKTILFYPNDISRLKLREYLNKENIGDSITIIKKTLWEETGKTSFNVYGNSGGTPLLYDRRSVLFDTIKVDNVMERIKDEHLGMLVLDMECMYSKVISGAKKTIERDCPTIIVNGFTNANYLWEAIIELRKILPSYIIRLRRYPSENIMEGHSIILQYSKETSYDKT